METKEEETFNTLARAVSTGQGKATAGTMECNEIPAQQNATEEDGDASVRRYEHLTAAAKAFIFTVIVKGGHAVYTIHYPGVFGITGYTEEEYASQPLLWFNMIYPEDKDVVLQQITQLLRGKTPPPIKHRILHKNGSVRWFWNTSIPVFDPQGKLIAYDGLVVDISEAEFAKVDQEHQIVELTSALAMVKTLQSLLPICCYCKNIRDDKGYWQQIEAYIEGHYSAIAFTHSICPDCVKRLYPQCNTEPSVLIDKAVNVAPTENQTLLIAGEHRVCQCQATANPERKNDIKESELCAHQLEVLSTVGLNPIEQGWLAL